MANIAKLVAGGFLFGAGATILWDSMVWHGLALLAAGMMFSFYGGLPALLRRVLKG